MEAVVRFLIVNGDTLEFKVGARIQGINIFFGFLQNRERRQAQKVELHKTHVFHVFLVVLTNRVFWRTVRVIKGTEVRQFPWRNQNAPSMHPEVTCDAFQGSSQTEELFILLVGFRGFFKFGNGFKRLLKRDVFPWNRRNHLRETIHLTKRHIEHTTHVAHHGLSAQGTKGGNLTHGVSTIGILHVLNRTVTVVLAKVHVKVRHGHTFWVQETFKKEVVLQGIQVGNPKRISHKRPSTRASPWAHWYAMRFRPIDKVLHDQEVARELHLLDDA